VIGKLSVPPLRDARWMQVAVLLAYAVVAREIFHFERTHLTTALCVLWAIALDLLLGALVYKKILFPLTPPIIGLASSLLLDARSALPYLGAVTLAVASKAALTYRGRHFMNPANFGVTVMLQLFPHQVTGMPTLFGGYLTPTLVFAALGLATVVRARQTEVSFSWILGFVVFGLLRAAVTGMRWVVALAPAFGPAFLLFSFHMISDPSTTPRTRAQRIGFGIAVALLDALLRLMRIPYGSFYALFVVCALNPWLRDREAKATGPIAALAR
jgi:Na+-translocating ferredoxin:NAD+ oxidoreductase RnfD subunit